MKTKVVYCKDTNRLGDSEHTSFDFLGYRFRGRVARDSRGYFMSFAPALSPAARKAISHAIRAWHLRSRTTEDLSSLAREIDPQASGWMAGSAITGLLSFRAALPCLPHRPRSGSMGKAQVQTTRAFPRSTQGRSAPDSRGAPLRAAPATPTTVQRARRQAQDVQLPPQAWRAPRSAEADQASRGRSRHPSALN